MVIFKSVTGKNNHVKGFPNFSPAVAYFFVMEALKTVKISLKTYKKPLKFVHKRRAIFYKKFLG